MADTGINYTRAARELEQREAAVYADTRMSTSAVLPDVNRASGYLATVQEAADRSAAFKIRSAHCFHCS